jgi:hypothetical protein
MHDPFFIRSSTFSMNQLSLKLPFICRSEQSVNFCVVYLFKSSSTYVSGRPMKVSKESKIENIEEAVIAANKRTAALKTPPRSSRKSMSASSVPQSLSKNDVASPAARSQSQSPKRLPPPDLDVLDDTLESSEKSPPIDNEDMEIVEDVTVDPMEGKGSLKLDSDSLLVGTVCTIHFLLGAPLLVGTN